MSHGGLRAKAIQHRAENIVVIEAVDERLIPRESAPHYSENIVWMPESYQPNDRKRLIADYAPTRTKVGLPETGFVFCAINNSYKTNPPTSGSHRPQWAEDGVYATQCHVA